MNDLMLESHPYDQVIDVIFLLALQPLILHLLRLVLVLSAPVRWIHVLTRHALVQTSPQSGGQDKLAVLPILRPL